MKKWMDAMNYKNKFVDDDKRKGATQFSKKEIVRSKWDKLE